MSIFYLMIEAVPNCNNPERKELGGAYVNCWVKAETKEEACSAAKEYIASEKWLSLQVEEAAPVRRQAYMDEPDSLKCYDEACKKGISAIFYVWPLHENGIN